MDISSIPLDLIIAAVLIIFLLKTYRKLKARFADSPYFIIAMGIGMLLFFLLYFVIDNPNYVDNSLSIVRNISHFLYSSAALFIFLYFDTQLEMAPSIKRFTLFFGIWLINTIIVVLDLLNAFKFEKMHNITGIIGYGIGILTILFAIRVNFMTIKLVSHKGVKVEATAILLVGISLTILEILSWMLLYDVIEELDANGMFFFNISYFCLIIGLFLLFVNTILNGDYIYFIPVEIHTIMIYNRTGILLYQYKDPNSVLNQSDKDSQDVDSLIAGAFIALSSIFKELLGQKSRLSYVQAENYEIFMAQFPHDVGTIVIVASRANAILKRSIKNFTQSISTSVLEDIEKNNEVEHFKDLLNPIIKIHFPYLNLDQKKN